MYFEHADIEIKSDLQLAASVVMEELRKHSDWYNTWVQMLSKCIWENYIKNNSTEDIAKKFIDDYLLGSD